MLDSKHVNIPSPEEPEAEMTLFQASAYARRLGFHVSDNWLGRFYDAGKFGNHTRLGKDAKPLVSVKALNQLIESRADLFPRPKRQDLPPNQYTVLEIADHLLVSPIVVLGKLMTSEISVEIHQLGYWLIRNVDLPHLQSLLGRRDLDLVAVLAKVRPVSQVITQILLEKGVDVRKEAETTKRRSTKKRAKKPDPMTDQHGWEHFKGLHTGEDGESRQVGINPPLSRGKVDKIKGPVLRPIQKGKSSKREDQVGSAPRPEGVIMTPIGNGVYVNESGEAFRLAPAINRGGTEPEPSGLALDLDDAYRLIGRAYSILRVANRAIKDDWPLGEALGPYR